MDIHETSRLILALRSLGWTEMEIKDLLLYIGTGEEQYKPKPNKA